MFFFFLYLLSFTFSFPAEQMSVAFELGNSRNDFHDGKYLNKKKIQPLP